MVAVRDWACALYDEEEGYGLKPPIVLDHKSVTHSGTNNCSLLTVFEVHLHNKVAKLGNSIRICVAHFHSGTEADSGTSISDEENEYYLALENLEHEWQFNLLCTDANISLLATQ